MGTFEFDGEKYKRASTHQKEWGRELITRLVLKGNERILDLGCGDGILTEQLADLVPSGRTVGIDASAGMIETAGKIEKDNLEFLHLDINKMDFKEEFDVIFSNAALHWVKDHERLLRSSYKALKPGGVILWSFAGEGNCRNFFEVIQRKMAEKKYAEYFRNFEWPWFMPSEAQYEKLISDKGFDKIQVSIANRDRFFPSAEEMAKWIEQPSIVPFIKNIPENMKESFLREVTEAMIEKTRQEDGTCFETFRRIEVYAVKGEKQGESD